MLVASPCAASWRARISSVLMAMSVASEMPQDERRDEPAGERGADEDLRAVGRDAERQLGLLLRRGARRRGRRGRDDGHGGRRLRRRARRRRAVAGGGPSGGGPPEARRPMTAPRFLGAPRARRPP